MVWTPYRAYSQADQLRMVFWDDQPNENLDILNEPWDGVFLLTSYASHATHKIDRSGRLRGFFLDSKREKVPGGSVLLGHYTLQPIPPYAEYGVAGEHSRHEGLDLFGDSINIAISPADSHGTNDTSRITARVYIPPLVTLDEPAFINLREIPYTPIRAGTIIRWNADTLNQNQVKIILEFDPESTQNEYIFKGRARRKTKSVRYIATNDTGLYTLSKEDLRGFPINSYINLSVARGVAIQLENRERKFLFYSYTVVACGVQLKNKN